MKSTRKTKSVKAILNEFESTDEAIAVVDLVERFQQEMNKTTVYRILDRLQRDGLLHTLIGKDGRKWYARCKEGTSNGHLHTHPHFQCKECGKVTCLSFEVNIPKLANHEIEAAELLIIGKCRDCIS